MSGLALKDDSTIEVKLASRRPTGRCALATPPSCRCPSDAFADPKAFGENPVGNGPYKMAKEGAWQHDSQIELSRTPTTRVPAKPRTAA